MIKDKKEGWIAALSSLKQFLHSEVLFAFPNPEHFGTTGGTGAGGSRSLVLHGNSFRVLNFLLGTAFQTVGFHQINLLIFLSKINHFTYTVNSLTLNICLFSAMPEPSQREHCPQKT